MIKIEGYKFDKTEKIVTDSYYGELKRLEQPNFDNFDRMVLLEFKKYLNQQSFDNKELSIDIIKESLNKIEVEMFNRLTTYKIEVK